jgi:alpha-galactosidase
LGIQQFFTLAALVCLWLTGGHVAAGDAAGKSVLPEMILDLGNNITMRLVKIPAGKFMMGQALGEKSLTWDDKTYRFEERTNTKPQTGVAVGSFYMGVYEVTRRQYGQFTKPPANYPYFKQDNDDHPLLTSTIEDCGKFCVWLSQKTGKDVRLPTEAQWEYACRAGSTSRYYFGDDPAELYKYANYCDAACSRAYRYRDRQHNDGWDMTAPVGSLKPNAWGLYDMLGNVQEMCFHEGETAATLADGKGKTWPIRGGAWNSAWGDAWGDCASATRSTVGWKWMHSFNEGFRVVVPVDPKTGEAALALAAPAAGAAKAMGDNAAAKPATAPGEAMQNVLRPPDAVIVVLDGGEKPLRAQDKGRWTHEDIVVETIVEGDRVTVRLAAPKSAVKRLGLQWTATLDPSAKLMCDAWERGYGDLEWKALDPRRVMPWYFLYHHKQRTGAAGVMTGPGAMCFWKASDNMIELHADVRSGGDGVMLGARTLNVCTVVQRHGRADQSAFSVLREFCRQMCPKPRLPAQPVYGFNNWYYDGGINAERFVGDAKFISRLSPDKDNRPYAVIDDGWQAGPGVWTKGNGKFPSMKDMADEIRKAGARPGLWTRLLQAPGSAPKEWRIKRDPSVAPKYIGNNVLDPTVPEVRKHVADQVKCIRQWGYELIKDDYSTYEVFGQMGNKMGEQLTKEGWSLADRSVTTAEAVREHYRNIRDAAGDGAIIIGCNTIGHLAAGIYEVNRIGDDTSAQHWWSTSRQGINALAFRLAQHNVFFAADPDCVGEKGSPQQPWEKNRQWLDLIARSGAALFLSVKREAVNADQEKELTEALRKAAKPQEVGEPLDWMEKRLPAKWRLGGQPVEFQW